MPKTFVSFDVDDTLLSGNSVHQAAFSRAFAEVFGIDASITEINHHGWTDVALVVELATRHGVPEAVARARATEAREVMVEYFRAHVSESKSAVLPGVEDLLEALASRGACLGLVTGNLEEIAWTKMEWHGLRGYFSVGGFGSDHEDRAELVKLALRRAEKSTGCSFRAFHVGDSPADLDAAFRAGARGIGVASGVFDAEELSKHPHHAVLPDLTDVEGFLRLTGMVTEN
ncbi:MAG: HAD family hydrolase [Promethearchaeota archaeon]